MNFMPAAGIRTLSAIVGISFLVLAGCETEPPRPEPVSEPEPPVRPAPEPLPEVEPLLEQARLAFEAHRLTTPEDDSAHALYQEVLRLDPENDHARRGIEKIVERYVRFALEAIERRQFARARSMLARARLVDAGHPAIEPTEQQMNLVENASRDRMRLDPGVLEERSSILGARLRDLGGRAKASACRVTINARSDAEGRWIYRQLNSAAGEARVRARLAIASPPSVELVCPGQPRQDQSTPAAIPHSAEPSHIVLTEHGESIGLKFRAESSEATPQTEKAGKLYSAQDETVSTSPPKV